MKFRNIYVLLNAIVLLILLSISAFFFLKNVPRTYKCYSYSQSTDILQMLKQEPIWRGIVVDDKKEKMIVVFVNSSTGNWTEVKVDVEGNVCFVDGGTEFQSLIKNTINL